MQARPLLLSKRHSECEIGENVVNGRVTLGDKVLMSRQVRVDKAEGDSGDPKTEIDGFAKQTKGTP